MRLLWLTPVHSRSAIARFSTLVVRCLVKRGFKIDVASIESDGLPSDRQVEFAHDISSLAEMDIEAVKDIYDLVIVNFGDHYPNHARGLDVLHCDRVVGLFHDADMENFGNGARAAGRDLEPLPGEEPVGRRVTAALAQRCGGAVAHSEFYRPVLWSCDGPVATIPLAWSLPGAGSANSPAPGSGADEGALAGSADRAPVSDGTPFRIVTFGNINRNKCTDRVIEAIASSDNLRNATHYCLYGAIETAERERLVKLALARKVQLTIFGAVSDDVLQSGLRKASVVSCLREPVLEGASASAIEAMLHGCAVLVSDAGFYADLPDECVAKVPRSTEPGSIRKVLDGLWSDQEARTSMGHRARRHAEDVFSPARYADSLLRVIDDVRVDTAYGPAIASIAGKLIDLGLASSSPATEIVLRSLETMAPVRRRNADGVEHGGGAGDDGGVADDGGAGDGRGAASQRVTELQE